jgi:hypothetical protein
MTDVGAKNSDLQSPPTLARPALLGLTQRGGRQRTVTAPTLCLALLAGCGHAAPRPTPQVEQAEHERRERLPDDNRTLDGTWDDVRVQVAYTEGRAWATLVLRHPKLRFFYQPPDAASKQAAADKAKKKAAADKSAVKADPAAAVPEALRKMAPFDVDRIEIQDGELVFVDMSKPAKPEIWLSELEVSIENVASRVNLAEGRPVLFTARAKVHRTGELALFVSADPWSEELNFSGRASIEGLATRELYSFLADTAKLQMPKGTLDMYITFTAKDGQIKGGVKPILKNVEVAPVRSGAMARLKAWAANTLLSLNSDRVKGRNAVVTVVPIVGNLAGPGVKLWPAIAGVLYNAYVNGVSAGFGGVPAAAPAQASAKASSDGQKSTASPSSHPTAPPPSASSAPLSQGESQSVSHPSLSDGAARVPARGAGP